jgi:cell division FtsZ-interacting protein ZapD
LDATDVQPAGNWTTVGTPTQQQQRRDSQFQSMTARLGIAGAICSFDVNDIVMATTLGYSLADQKRHIQNYVTAMNNAGLPVLFVCGFMRDPASVAATDRTQLDIIQMYRDVSDASSDICGAAFLDLSTSLNGNSVAQRYAAQWRDTLYVTSSETPPLHPNSTGHAKHGTTIANAIIDASNRL